VKQIALPRGLLRDVSNLARAGWDSRLVAEAAAAKLVLAKTFESKPDRRPDLDRGHHWVTNAAIAGVIGAGLIYVGYSIYSDIDPIGSPIPLRAPYFAIFIALLIALTFEFINGFHDTANAVATVIYTRALPPHAAVVWSGLANLAGVLLSSGAVAYAIIALLPVELILQVGRSDGIVMVFALLFAAITWNLGTWYLGLPVSSSHTMIGSIIGVGVANALIYGREGTSGVNWSKAVEIGYSLLLSPFFGFVIAGLLLLTMKLAIGNAWVRTGTTGDQAPPWGTRGALIMTCTAVSFFHGANDGQKGMNLVMLILIGTIPNAYALNRALPPSQIARFEAASTAASQVIADKASGYDVIGDPRPAVELYVSRHSIDEGTYPCLAILVRAVAEELKQYGSIARMPPDRVAQTRNDMCMASESVRLLMRDRRSDLSADDVAKLREYQGALDRATKFIPLWVKVAVAIALGIGTMIGWKRIVITVGERIGKAHLSFAQGACAEVTAAATIAVADGFGLPVSTTHVLSSGIAGTMQASGAGLQWPMVRNILLAWVFALPAAMIVSGGLYWLFSRMH
jgi:PiT family inorganic phosphate transporter